MPPPGLPISPRKPRVVVSIVAGVAVLFGLRLTQMAAIARVRGLPYDLWSLFRADVGFWLAWTAVALLAAALLHRVSLARLGPSRLILAHAGIALLAVALQPALDTVFESVIVGRGAVPYAQVYRLKLVGSSQFNLVVAAMAGGIVHAVAYYARFRERDHAASALAEQLSQARLDALRAQLNPHFLFNALNAVAMLARQGATQEVVRMVTGLSDLLRRALDDDQPQEVPLREEIAIVERYLGIEQIRFENRLRVEVALAPGTEDALVPSFVLQPLAENAIRHGVSHRIAAGLVQIHARRDGDALVVDVRDEGPGPPPQPPAPDGRGRGVGLRNTRARLAQLYGDDQALVLRAHPGGGAVATLRVPFRTAPAPLVAV